MTLQFCFLEGESQLKYIFCKKSVSKIYEWFLKLCECLLWVILNTLCQALVSEMNFTNNFWMIAYFYNRYNDSKTGKMFYLVQKKKCFEFILQFLLTFILKKTLKQCLNHAKMPTFCACCSILKRQNPDYVRVACKPSYYLEKGGNMEKKYLVWKPIFRNLLHFRRCRG